MSNSRVPGSACQTRHHQNVKDGTVSLQATGAPGITGIYLASSQPNGSFVRFGLVGGKAVFWEYADGKPRTPSVRYGEGAKTRDYYQDGDFFNDGEFEVSQLRNGSAITSRCG